MATHAANRDGGTAAHGALHERVHHIPIWSGRVYSTCIVTPLNNGSCRNFQPSLKGRSVRQTASTRVVELSIRYMRLFRTSPTDLYSYGTCVNMSISSHPIRRGMRIMRSSRLVRSTGSQHHHAHPIYPCRERRVGNGKASNHADPMHATRMQPAGSWAARATSSR